MDLPVLAEDPSGLVDEDRTVEMVRATPFDRQLRKPEIEAYSELSRAVEQRLRRGVGHLALEIGIDVVLPFVVPMREKGRERAFRKNHEVAAVRRGLSHQRDQARDGLSPGFGARDRAELGGTDGDDARHSACLHGNSAARAAGPLPVAYLACASAGRQLAFRSLVAKG